MQPLAYYLIEASLPELTSCLPFLPVYLPYGLDPFPQKLFIYLALPYSIGLCQTK
uniref:Uncharacterized protein n=1 Tax=Utricularia reniformis TaxID=192314 RepID=A0A1Y0B475_9LAMI|nr:hypothetical protein AEK19_MT2028 [Utricularia reniformis]ART32187.1 hypothetical protein AEK19_MT2028 [Utricularia reniformis]